MLEFADHAFFVLHTGLIVFNVVGWAWAATRVWHLVTLGATAFSWFVLGAWYGWGYCLCTDYHFRIRQQLGYVDLDSSYIQLLARHWVGTTIDRTTADGLAGTVFLGILVATIVVWTRPRRDAVQSTSDLGGGGGGGGAVGSGGGGGGPGGGGV